MTAEWAMSLWSGVPELRMLAPMTDGDEERALYRKQLGLALKRSRETTFNENGTHMTQAQVAAFMDVDVGTISRWERGGPDMKLYDVVRLARRYSMPGDWVINPPDSTAEREQFARRRQVAQAAAQAAAEDERARTSGAGRSARLGRSRPDKPSRSPR